MSPYRRPSYALLALAITLIAGIASAGCDLADRFRSPAAPSPATPPAAGAPVHYTAIGASDANGVGGSVPCVPFTACEGGTGYVPVLARQLRLSREVTLVNPGFPPLSSARPLKPSPGSRAVR